MKKIDSEYIKMITSKQKYLVILERTLRSYSKELQQRLFPNIFPPYVLFVSSAILVNQLSSEGFWIGLHIKNGKPQATFGDNSGHYGSVFGPQELPDYVCKQYPTLPLWEKAIRDAVKNRLIKLMKL